MPKQKKLNSMRLLDANALDYQVSRYDKNIRDAKKVAAALGAPAEALFKTLVVLAAGGGKPCLALLPANTTLNLKKLAAAIGEKKVSLAAHAAAEKLTGLQVGGISPLALMHKQWRVYVDRRAQTQARLIISAGQRGLQLHVEREGLLRLLNATLLDIAEEAADS